MARTVLVELGVIWWCMYGLRLFSGAWVSKVSTTSGRPLTRAKTRSPFSQSRSSYGHAVQ
jgi:hypothetical protein